MVDLPIHVAANRGNTEEVRRLLEAKEEDYSNLVNVKEIHGWTPLIHASSNGHFETAHFLLGNGASVDNVNDEGRSALWYASHNGHFRVACLLLHHGASCASRCCKWRKPNSD
jgi:uncharacterized protein